MFAVTMCHQPKKGIPGYFGKCTVSTVGFGENRDSAALVHKKPYVDLSISS
jgi:hypothetical protein